MKIKRARKFHPAIRALALARASHACERCQRTEFLTLHHLDRNRNDLANARVLCVTCHFWEHHTRKRHHKH
jgi:hypothetical protein